MIEIGINFILQKVLNKFGTKLSLSTKEICLNLFNQDRVSMNQSIKELQLRSSKFCDDRDWNQFHSPKSLAMSISIEAAELLENFQWSKDDEPLSTTNKESISEEIADVLIYAIRLCEVLEVDPIEISNKKIDKNAIKYPVDISKGKSEKYTNLK